jgi:hypothetical protein
VSRSRLGTNPARAVYPLMAFGRWRRRRLQALRLRRSAFEVVQESDVGQHNRRDMRAESGCAEALTSPRCTRS